MNTLHPSIPANLGRPRKSFAALVAGWVIVVQMLWAFPLYGSGIDDSLAVIKMSEDVWAFFPDEPRKGLVLAEEELALAKRTAREELIASGYNDIGACYIYTGSFDSAIIYLDSCLTLRLALGDARGAAAVHNKKGVIFQNQGLVEEAIRESELSLPYFLMQHDTLNIANILNNLAELNSLEKAYGKSLSIHREALKYRVATRDTMGYATTLFNMGTAYVRLGDTVEGMRLFDVALETFRQMGARRFEATVYQNKGAILADQGKYALAEACFLASLAITDSVDSPRDAGYTLTELGDLYRRTKAFPKAMDCLRRAYQIALGMDSNLDAQSACADLALLFEDMGRMDSAYHYLQESQRLSEEIFNANSVEALHRAQVKFDVRQKDNENLLLKKDVEFRDQRIAIQNARTAALVAILLLLVLLGLVIVLRLRNRQKSRVLAMQQANIAALIQGEQQERVRVSRDLHDGLGQLLSTARIHIAALEEDVPADDQAMVQNTLSLLDKAVTEVRNVSHNLMPDALSRRGLLAALESMVADVQSGGGPKLVLNMEQPPQNLSNDQNFALYRLLQELVTNALRHAAATEIWITGMPTPKGYLLEVGDNGQGIANPTTPNKGIGTQNVAARLSFLGGSMEVRSGANQGTIFRIHLPQVA